MLGMSNEDPETDGGNDDDFHIRHSLLACRPLTVGGSGA
jgi:hypothetical protein